ncbi:hypothetical protein B9Z55_012063 [Caenorhabditis nigoni]|uniref:Uncharacterized protein n=1 Tax=Caenorhabditis nigoni TaxID=1611254 RepID=A0A2G5TVN9_9PELO|nr:hypothetical protein B9Z55_012063 [Caenorhabditis nigoni]
MMTRAGLKTQTSVPKIKKGESEKPILSSSESDEDEPVRKLAKKAVTAHRNMQNLSEFEDDDQEPMKLDKPIKSELLTTPKIPKPPLDNEITTNNLNIFETGREKAMGEFMKNSQFEPTYMKNMKIERANRERERHRSSIKANESEFVGSHSQSCEVSNNNKWNPISFGRKYMYDSNEGVPLSKAAIEEGIMKLTKNKRPFDSSEFLKIASEFHGNSPLLESLSIGMAFNSGFRNSSQSGNTSNLKPFIISNIGFNLTQAKKNESLIVLPSGCQFFMSQALTNYQASNYTSSEYKTHGKSIVRRIFSIIATKDPFFPAYSASENTHCYCPLGSSFFTKISNFLISGFVQTQSDELETYTIRMCRDALGNLIDRVRKQFIVHHPETNAEQLAIELKSLLTSHGNVPNNMEFLSEHDENEQPSTSSAGY